MTLSVGVSGSQPLFYQWQKNGANLGDGGNVLGASAGTLSLVNISAADAGTYSVTVSNAFGSAASSNAVVSVATLTATEMTRPLCMRSPAAMTGATPMH